MYYFKLSLAVLLATVLWLAFVLVGAFQGWWMTPIASSGDTEEFFQKAIEILEAENQGNSAFLLIENGQLVKEFYSSSKETIDSDTVFSTASMSKWLTASAIMKLVQDGKVDLDAPVSEYLTRWELPRGEFNNNEVTVRRLLSHTAGLTDGLGFGDYKSEETLPTLEESLNNPRASSDRDVILSVQIQPGTQFIYSGGSFLILQLLIEEVSGMSFEDYMNASIFEPLEMTRSTYDFIGDVENSAGSYDRNGQAAPLYKYASSAATGFSTSGSDLSRFVLAQIPIDNERSVLTENTRVSMRKPYGQTMGFDIWGLGTILYSPTPNDDFVFGHDGGNDPAINSTARINPDNRDAVIVLVTGHPSLATNIGSQWLLWQTGYPDLLDADAIIQSMFLPAIFGILVLAAMSGFLCYRHYRQQLKVQHSTRRSAAH